MLNVHWDSWISVLENCQPLFLQMVTFLSFLSISFFHSNSLHISLLILSQSSNFFLFHSFLLMFLFVNVSVWVISVDQFSSSLIVSSAELSLLIHLSDLLRVCFYASMSSYFTFSVTILILKTSCWLSYLLKGNFFYSFYAFNFFLTTGILCRLMETKMSRWKEIWVHIFFC